MYKYLLQSIEGIAWFGTVALLIFFTLFCLALWRAISSRNDEMQYMAELPLQD
ncbi:MAG: CcoQ/FixQ family Cbb3-type cytochrome c oxidase assembly chaperone [Saprospiraceae bacterium]